MEKYPTWKTKEPQEGFKQDDIVCIYSSCMESYPCQHGVTLFGKDKNVRSSGLTIWKQMKKQGLDNFDKNAINHFKRYENNHFY